MEEKRILIISGPTASGKSELAKIIANKINGVIINADSMQIYKELPILSSQPNKEDLDTIEHLLYCKFTYNERSSVGLWLKLVYKAIDEALKLNKLPIIVGGTGMYISALVNGISQIPEIDKNIRTDSRQLYEEINREEFIKILTDLGEDKKDIINLDKQRLIRNLEVLKQTGKTIKWWHNHSQNNVSNKTKFIHINLEPERKKLYETCNERFKTMLTQGAIEEVQELMKLNIDNNLPITKTIGYFEISNYLNNVINKEELLEKSCQKTRNYAKRQLTWFRNQFQDKFIINDPRNVNSIQQILELIRHC